MIVSREGDDPDRQQTALEALALAVAARVPVLLSLVDAGPHLARTRRTRRAVVVTVPWVEESLERVSYVVERGYITIHFKPGAGTGLIFDEHDVTFHRSEPEQG